MVASVSALSWQKNGTTNMRLDDFGNLDLVGNYSTDNYGFFGWLGSVGSFVTGLFVQDINLTGTLNGNGSIDIGGNIETSGNLTVDTNTLFVDSSINRVGVMTTSPNHTLDVFGDIRVTSDIIQTTGGTFAAAVNYDTGSNAADVSIGDVNNDGYADLAVVNKNDADVSVFINNGNGTFATKVDYATGTSPNSVSIGDVNNDGYADLAVSNQGSQSVSVFINDGDGTFAAAVNYTTGTASRSVVIGDVDNDGYADIAAVGGAGISVFINDGDGIFAAEAEYATGSNPLSIAMGDVNNDGYADLATANYNSHNVSVLINNGNGTFATKVDYTVGTNPNSVFIGDINNDGYADIATANNGDDNVSILINDGDGTFETKVDYAVGTNPNSVFIGDVNNDGYADLATGGGSGNISVFINNGDGTFATKIGYTGANPVSVVMGDVNNDGYVDIATANSGINSVSVFINSVSTGFSVDDGNVTIGGDLNVSGVYYGNGSGLTDVANYEFGSNNFNGSGNFTTSGNVDIGGDLNVSGSVNVGDNTTTGGKSLHIADKDDAFIWLEADTDNTGGEDDNAYLRMTHDGGLVDSFVGLVGVGGVDPAGDAYTDTLGNSLLVGFTSSQASGAVQLGTNKNVRMTVTSSGNVGIGTNAPNTKLTVNGDTNLLDGGNLYIGHTGGISLDTGSSLQVLGTANGDNTVTIGRFSNNDNPPRMRFVKSRSGTIGTNVIVADNDDIGSYEWTPADGANFDTKVAIFKAEVDDSSPAAGDIGTAFVWEQMPGDGGALTETMRLGADGTLNVTNNLIVGGNFTVGEDLNVTGDLYAPTIYEVSSQGLILAMNFNNKSINGDVVLDSSIRNNHGTNNGATHNVTGGFNGGGAYEFDGADDYIELDNASMGNVGNETTISFWVKEASNANFGYISNEQTGSKGFAIEGGRFAFIMSGTNLDLSHTAISDFDWHHMVYTFNGTGGAHYRDNILIVSGGSATGTPSVSTEKLRIGFTQWAGGSEKYMNGTIDEVKIYDRVLSTDEITRLYLQRAEVGDSYVSQRDVYVDAVGNVGIGTTSPEKPLHISNSAIDMIVRFESGDAKVGLELVDDTATVGIFQQGGKLSFDINNDGIGEATINSGGDFNVNNTFFVDASEGRVGIGTINPSSTLDVNGTASVSGNFVVDTNDFFVNANTGYVGINTSTPSRQLHIKQKKSGTAGMIRIEDDSDTSYWEIGMRSDNRYGIWYYNGSDLDTEVFGIRTTGEFGIGTSLPDAKLEVVGTVNLNDTLYVDGLGNVGIGTASPAHDLDINDSSGTASIKLTGSGGKVIQSVSSTYSLLFQSDVGAATIDFRGQPLDGTSIVSYRFGLTSGSTGRNRIMLYEPGSADIATMFTTDGYDSWINRYGGNLGIWTNTPNSALEVAGDVNLNDTLYVITSGNVGIGTSTPEEKLHLANGTFLQTPGDPVLEGVLINSTNMNGAISVYVSGKYAYVAGQDSHSLTIVDISNPSSPTLAGVLINSTNMNGPESVYVSGKYAYVASYGSDSLAIVDISNPSSPTLEGVLSDSANLNGAYSVYVSGKYAYVASYENDSLSVLDISNPSSPTLEGVLSDSANLNGAYSVYVSGKYAYVTGSDSHSLAIVDISDPTSPTLAGSLIDSTNMSFPISVYVSGKYAYVAGSNSDSLAIVDISDPTSPTLAGVLKDSTNMDWANSVYVSGKYAYVTSEDSDSLAIVDISDPSSPTLAGSLNDSTNMDFANSVYVSGKYAYVASYGSNSLAIVDIGGIDAPAASIGDLAVSTLDVSENLDVGNDLSIGSGLVVGENGIYSQGRLSVYSALNETVLRLQDADGTCLYNPEAGDSVVSCSSDKKLKKNIKNASSALEEFEDVVVRDYVVKASGKNMTGVIAQEINETHPEMVHEEGGELFVELPSSWKLLKAIQELQEMFEALIGGNYSVESEAVFDSDMVGTATVLVNSTFVSVEFNEEYSGIPIVTLTVVGLPDFFYGVDEVTNKSFKILISEVQEEEIIFNWHAFVREVGEVVTPPQVPSEVGNVSNVTINETENLNITVPANLTDGNVTINETNITIPGGGNETNITIPETSNETGNVTIPINETEEPNETTPELNITIPENNESEEIIINKTEKINESLVKKDKNSSQEIIKEDPVGEELVVEGVVSPITGAAVGVGNQDNIFIKMFDWIGGLFD
jgi:hypothetical protein